MISKYNLFLFHYVLETIIIILEMEIITYS
jgi:hypothetical protein